MGVGKWGLEVAVSEGQISENEIRYPWKGECCTQRKEKDGAKDKDWDEDGAE